MSGAIELVGVSCRCKVGVPAAERARRQRIRLDLTVSVDLEAACRSDGPADTPDYQRVEEAARAAAEGAEFKLLERLAAAAGEAVLASDPRIRAVAVAARKRPAAMPRTREVVVRLALTRLGPKA